MLGTPLDVLPYIRGIQMVLSGYSGYSKGKRRDADKLIREEIERAAGRARNHISNVHDSAFKDGAIPIARAAKAACTEIDALIEDVDKAPAGMDHAFLSGTRSASKSDLKMLIKHDHDVIEMVTKSVNIANSVEHAFNKGSNPEEIIQLIRQCQQMSTSCRGFFGTRATILGGLRQKKKLKKE